MRGRKPDITPDPDALTSTTKPPLWLTKAAKMEWKRLLPIMIERQVLTAGDLASFASYYAATGQVIDAQTIIVTEGMTLIGASGPKKHPAVGIMNDAQPQSRHLAAEFVQVLYLLWPGAPSIPYRRLCELRAGLLSRARPLGIAAFPLDLIAEDRQKSLSQ